jgi:GT2 family glycosyltransferase/acetyltransferase-like isoleucine patch superfamily enzyme
MYLPPVDGRPLVSVLVVTYGHEDEIGSCLDAALRQRGDTHDLEIIVVDNASTDGTVAVVERFGDDVKLLALDRNVGFAEGVNTAFAASSGEVVVLLNPDCVMDDGCVEALWRHLANNPGVGTAAALLRYLDGRPQLFARRELTMSTVLWCFTEIGKRIDKRRGGPALAARRYEHEMKDGITEPLVVDCPVAACIATWRRLLEPRPMDPAFPLVFNDADLFRRLREQAYRSEIIPNATAGHGYGTSLQRVARPRMRAEFVASMRRYQAPVWSRTKLTLLWAIFVLDALTSLVMSVTGPNRRAARVNARGTLGGLGLPGGARPWLAPIWSPPGRAKAVAQRARPHVRPLLRRVSRRTRRRWFIVRLHVAAWLSWSRVRTDIHRTADLSTDVSFEVRPRCRPHVIIGPDVEIQSGLKLRLAGTVEIGHRSQIRYDTVLNVKGHLLLAGRNIIGRNGSIHADTDTVFEWGACLSEYVTIVDSDHGNDGSAVHMFDQPVIEAPIHLGAGSFIAAQSVVTAGASVGMCAVVGANSVVTRDIPPGVIAVGTPAKAVRALPAWWAQPASSK